MDRYELEKATEFLKDEGLILQGNKRFIIHFSDDKQIDLAELLAKFSEERVKDELEEDRIDRNLM